MYLGIEIGGTKLQLGIGPGDGTLQAFWRGEVDPDANAVGIRQQILDALPELFQQSGLAKCHLHGVGVGFGGPVDDAANTVLLSHQILGWEDFPLTDWITDTMELPAALGNDADVAGLAETLFGAGKGLSPVFYMTIGSGIGGGLIVGGEIYRGIGKGAAEIGHLLIPHRIDSEYEDTLEAWASGWGIGAAARARMHHGHGRDSEVFRLAREKVDNVSTLHVGKAASKGDAFAVEILEEARRALAIAITHVITLLCPRRLVIGGGVSLLGEDLLFAPLRRMVAERCFEPFADCYDIVPAALGEEVVVHGALALARKQLSR